jgi:hypothetical protein
MPCDVPRQIPRHRFPAGLRCAQPSSTALPPSLDKSAHLTAAEAAVCCLHCMGRAGQRHGFPLSNKTGNKMDEKILQIIPADDWFAIFKMDDEAELSMPLNCWALFQRKDGSSTIEGVYVDAAGDCTVAKSAQNFVRYKRLSTVIT